MILLVAATAGVAVLFAFVALEERRRPDIAVLVVVGITVADSVLFPHQGSVPVGPFRPSFGGQDLRLPDVLIPAALGARLLVRGLPSRVTGEGLLWTAFFLWYAFAGLVGLTRGQPTNLVLFQGKFVLETGGMIALVAGVPIARLTQERLVERIAIAGGALAAVLLPLAAAGVSIPLPFLARAQLGKVAPDAATILSTIGIIILVLAVCREWPNPVVVVGGGLLAVTPIVANQRAALLHLSVAAVIVLAVMTGRTWRRRSAIRIATLVPLVCVLLLPMGVAAVRSASTGESIATTVPLATRLGETFGSEQKVASADTRVGLLRQGRNLTRSRPLIGRGLGQPAVIINHRTDAAKSIGDFHNILVDLAVRTGLTGVVLFVLAVATTMLAGFRRWGDLLINGYAALTLAATAAMVGLISKGLFETIFQKFRLAVLLGFLIGVIVSSNAAARATASRRTTRERAWT